jgi:phycoerythrin-associated linker protein
MVSQFINPKISRASELGVERFEDTAPLELWPEHSEAEVETIVQAVYRQVLGNAYVMESERLVVPESKLKRGEISVREFVRQVAKSELYRARFFENCPRYRSIELNFKHLLGRAPESYEEMQTQSQILDEGGWDAEIDSYLDRDEYLRAFGENVVPFYRGYKTQIGQKAIAFPHFFQLLRGASSSDKDLANRNRSRLNRLAIANIPSPVTPLSAKGSGLTDVERLLAEVLKPKIQPQAQLSYSEYMAKTEANLSLQHQCQEQESAIALLEQQLAELRPYASLVQAKFSRWQSSGTETTATPPRQSQWKKEASQPESYLDLQQRSQEQARAIAALEQEIAQLRPYASIAEAQLNKWRSRTFSR